MASSFWGLFLLPLIAIFGLLFSVVWSLPLWIKGSLLGLGLGYYLWRYEIYGTRKAPVSFLKLLMVRISVLVLLVLCLAQPPSLNSAIHKAQRTATTNLVTSVRNGVVEYLSDYGQLPTSTESMAIKNCLVGKNPRGTVYIELRPNNWGDRDLFDSWGTPIRIKFGTNNQVTVTSAGPDKIFGTKDDIIVDSETK